MATESPSDVPTEATSASPSERTLPRARRSLRQIFGASILPRAFRLGLLAAVAALLYVAGQQPPPPDEISLESAKLFFPAAAKLAKGDVRLGGQGVLDEKGKTIGLLLTTSPHADDLIGYSGPSNLLIALDVKQQVIGVHILSSGDTPSHVEQIRTQRTFWQQFIGENSTQRPAKLAGVSGSTLTSMTFAEGIDRRLHGTSVSLRFPETVKLREIRKLFKEARKFEADNPRVGWNKAWDAEGNHLGYVVRTSPYSDNARGYQGPTESLVAIDAAGKTVIGMLVRKSYDTEEYVERVRPNDDFRDSLINRSIDDWAKIDFAKEGIEGVSGATQTSFAIADGIRRRFAAEQSTAVQTAAAKPWNFQPGLVAVICGGLGLTFTPLKNSRRLRVIWQVVLIAVFAFWLGDLLSLALFVGWARHGIPWRTAPAVVLLVAVSLVIPWATRRQIYCQQLCPHGAAQSWLGQFKRLHVRISNAWQRRLGYFPPALLAVSLLLATFVVGFDLASLEPFDAWVLKGAAAISAAVALVGLIASVFVPQAYCRYGCPTGELLKIVKSGGSHDRIQRRDLMAGGLVLIVAAGLYGPQLGASLNVASPEAPATTEARVVELGGRAFGTTWSVKLRGDHQVAPLQAAVSAELERIESTLSHWRPESSTSQFNASETTFETEQPAELVALVARALELSKLSDGSYDITVAPLVDAWGFGPTGERAPPGEQEVADILQRTGWEKLIVDSTANTLRKKHPQLQIDLGSLLQGYSADRTKKVLDEAGVSEYLIDVGGELLARGAWPVGIEDPHDPAKPLRTFILKDAALATSGIYRAKRENAAGTVHHLISPRTGKPEVTKTMLCAVVAPTAVEADAWATVLLAVGVPAAMPLADQQQLSVLVLDQEHGVQTNAAGNLLFEPK
ncbi:Thiamine biosynthesis lipoprotein ApbE precursor [Anatilimnocola aggregata]|uniref:FAD:protein FMN transferase n=1 Tax=Anatilimnocola aggregata TaxID=2528021 RepID=A0A517YJ55_9BACT|nr:FAD:protein FMN transferase [Anatilimnocola aggregata]QDU30244.1 Thiamine biosynthesis lipoprotein ApbE precursor [Anatilimnocola aggregata]